MKMKIRRRVSQLLVVLLGVMGAARPSMAAEVVINEIMYHPASENVLEEYVELLNQGATNINLTGWQFSSGVRFTFTNALIPAGGYLVVAADLATFTNRYPGVTNVVGNWTGILSNSRDDLDLDDALGDRVDSVRYADDGDWALRVRGPLSNGHRGWEWLAEHDGLGKSAELINPRLSNNSGQNWAASLVTNGTPGSANSVLATNVPPLILEVKHFPVVPTSTDTVVVTGRLLDELTNGLTLTLHWRVDAANPPPFAPLAMSDDGLHEDGAPADGVFAATLPAQGNNTVVEFFLEASDLEGNRRTWPAAARQEDGSFAQTANVLYQVDDSLSSGSQPLYKLIMRGTEQAELYTIGHSSDGSQNSDAQMNGTFISLDGTGTQLRYVVGFRNRGHGSRNRQPNNYRVNFRADDPWKNVTALNLNGQYTHLQHFGSVISLKSGLAGAESRPVQVRVNNQNYGSNSDTQYGTTYVANEAPNSDYAAHRFPSDSSGNLYRAIRDIAPSSFNYRGEDPHAYTNTWFKQTNESEDDWTDLIRMLRVVGTNDLYTPAAVRQVADIEQWMLYLAVMGLFDNRETSLYNGENDDYVMYCGVEDPRFRLLYYDLDTILGRAGSTSNSLFECTRLPAFNRLLNDPEFRPIYFRTLQRLIDTTFSADQFNTLLDQTLGDYVPANILSGIKTWMDGRRAYARSQIPPDLPPLVRPPVAMLAGTPRSPTPARTAAFTVGGEGVTHYRFQLNGAGFSPENPVATPIQFTSLPTGTNQLRVVGRNADGLWQAETNATAATWVVDLAWPAVRLNEVLAANVAALGHGGKFPDLIELYNEGPASADLSGLRLTDNPENPDKFTFPAGTSLDANDYLILYANNPDGSSGFHVRFSLNQDGDGVYLFDRAAAGNTILDSVVFGRQVSDLSIGRLSGSGEWVLTEPTFGSTNSLQVTGDPRGLKINEWFTDGRLLFDNDFVELYNPASLPGALGGLFLTDNLSAAPNRHPISPLSFIAASGYLAFEADGDPGQGPDHLNFKLAPEQGEVGLFAADLSLIDSVIYGPQRTDVSQGRSPNGATTLAFFLQPTPGAPNLYRPSNVSTQTLVLVALTNVWSFNQTANLTSVNWFDLDYDDRTWPTGPALLWHDPDVWPGPRNTPLDLGRMTYYFRTHFTFTGDPATATLRLSPQVDDGAVFYLNGELAYPLRMDTNAPITYDTSATESVNNADHLEGPSSLPGVKPRVGDNVLAVEVHQSGLYSQDIVFGAELSAVVTITNHLTLPVVLNEVFAHGQIHTNLDGTTSDWIELFNPALTNLDLAGLSLTDDLDQPRKWVFPAGSIIPGGGHLVLRCDDARPASAANTGFALDAAGDELHLFDRTNALLDSVKFGLQATDYSIGRVADGFGAWTLTLPTEGTDNLPAALGDPAALKINEWMADPATGDDWLELYNPSLQPVDLSGLCLSDDPGNRALSPIPALSFIGAGGDAYRRFIADGDQLKGADHTRFRLEATGESLALYTGQGRVVDSLSFGFQPWNVAQGRFPDGTAAFASFPDSPSPAESNYLPLTNLVINELLSHTDPPLEDAVEVHNLSDDAVNLGGWFLSNTARDLRKYPLPDPTVVPAHGYAVLYERGFGNTNSPTVFTFNSAHGDEVHLSQPGGSGSLTGYRAVARFGAVANGVSFGRYPTSIGADFVAMNRPTFGVDNPQTLDQFRQGTGAANSGPRVGPVVINEIMYHPPDLGGTNDNTLDEFVELANLTPNPVRLYDLAAPTNTWRLGGGIDYVFPTNTTIPPSGFLLLVNFDPFAQPAASNAFRAKYNLSGDALLFGPYRDKLANDRATVTLYQPDPPQLPPHPDAGFVPQVVVDRILYTDTSPWPTNADGWGESLQRIAAAAYGNEPLNWRAAPPTPGSANGSLPPDSDGDGMADAWELNHFGTLARDGSGDFDGDALTDLGEYLAGTDPGDPASALRLTLDPVPGEGARLQFTARAGRSYTLQSRDRLSYGTWLKLQDVPDGTVERVVQFPIASTGESRFYRLVLPSQP